MTLKKFKRSDSMVGAGGSFISIRPNTISFSSEFVKVADLKKYKNASVFFDDDEYVVGFKFHSDDDPDAFTLYSDATTKSTRNIAATQILNKIQWLDAVARQKDPLLKRFPVVFDSIDKVWKISIIPVFEHKVSDRSEIPSNTRGVYRYLKDSEIVYIGKGEVKSRARSPERKNWEFDAIKYSLVEDADKQDEWESYWLDKFKKKENRLPLYNKLLGKKIESAKNDNRS